MTAFLQPGLQLPSEPEHEHLEGDKAKLQGDNARLESEKTQLIDETTAKQEKIAELESEAAHHIYVCLSVSSCCGNSNRKQLSENQMKSDETLMIMIIFTIPSALGQSRHE